MRSLITLCVFVVCCALAVGETWATPNKRFTLGTISILSGEGSAWGTATRRGVDLAITDLNAQGGILQHTVVASHQDDGGDPKRSLAAFRQLTELEKVQFIIGPNWSNLGVPLITPALRSKTLMISPSLGVATFNEAHEFLFNTKEHDSISSRRLAEHVYAKGFRTVAVITAQQVWCEEQSAVFKKRFEELGGSLAITSSLLPGTTDVRSEALRIKSAKNVEAHVYTTDGIVAGSLVAKALKDLKVVRPSFSVILDQPAIDAADGGLEGAEILSSFTPTEEFSKRYLAVFNEEIQVGADTAYDAVMLLAQAIKRSGSFDTERVSQSLASIREFQGVSGALISDGKRGFFKSEGAFAKIISGRMSYVSKSDSMNEQVQ